MRIVKLTEKEKNNILENLLKRSPNQYSKFEDTVNDIIENVRANKDKALFEYTEKFDGVKITEETFKVTDEEIEEAYTKVDERLIEIIRKALVNIRDYHQKQVRYSWFDSKTDGTLLGQKITPLARVGVYVPGGKAVYPSSVLMNIVPAKVAGVEKIVMTTPRLHTAFLALSCSRALIFALVNIKLIAHRKANSALSRSAPKRLAHGSIKHGQALA